MSVPDPAALPIRAQVLALRASLATDLRAPVPSEARAETALTALPWRTGERLQAVVESALAGSRYLVRIDQLAFDVQLPADVRVGDRLQLTYAGATPRPQFVLVQEEPPPSPGTSARLDLSREGRALAAALAPETAHDAPVARSATTLLPTPAVLLQAAPDATAPLVAALKGAIDSSGLFYESHLGEWVEGTRPMETVLREPQARLALAPEPSQPTPQSPRAEDPARASAPRPDGAPPAGATNAHKAEPAAIHAQALPLVRGQLETLETGQLLWAGQAWPGQPLEWQLQEVRDEGRSPSEPAPWSTRLRLTLPRLGAVTADLQLSGNGLRLKLAAAEPSARVELEAARQALSESLTAAGLVLAGFAAVGEND
jgi:hypothetical protein